MITSPLVIPLGLPSGKSQKLFLAYLNSELANRTVQSEAKFTDADDGVFDCELITTFKEECGGTTLRLHFVTAANKLLSEVEVTPVGEPGSDSSWRDMAHSLISSALSAALSERRSTYFTRRQLYYVGQELDGEYWLGGFRFAPAEPIPSEMPVVQWERAVFLDFNVDAIDKVHAMYLATQAERTFAARLSLLLDVDLYTHSHPQVWALHPDDGSNVRCNRGYHGGPHPSSMPRKGEICRAGRGAPLTQIRYATDLMRVPTEARRFLKFIDRCEPGIRTHVDGAARLYQIGLSLRVRFPSAALAYSVAAIDALCKTVENCNINEFFARYSPLSSKYPELAKKLWGDFRSAHFHAGGFALREFEERRIMDTVIDADAVGHMKTAMWSNDITREAIVNWILSVIPAAEERTG